MNNSNNNNPLDEIVKKALESAMQKKISLKKASALEQLSDINSRAVEKSFGEKLMGRMKNFWLLFKQNTQNQKNTHQTILSRLYDHAEGIKKDIISPAAKESLTLRHINENRKKIKKNLNPKRPIDEKTKMNKMWNIYFDFTSKNENIQEWLKKNPQRENGTLNNILVAFASNKIPTEILFQTLLDRDTYIEKCNLDFQEKLPALLEEVNTLFDQHKYIKTYINREYRENRLKNSKILIADPLVCIFENNLGHYNKDTHSIFLDPRLARESLPHVLIHEILHALSGQTVLQKRMYKETETDEELKNSHASYEVQRIGMRIIRDNQFQWLNEGITELLAQEVYPLPTSYPYQIYPDEINLVRLLRESGKFQIPIESFLNAYFEDYDTTKDDRVPAWKNLIGKLNESYAPGILNKVDSIIRGDSESGIIDATNYLKKIKYSQK